MDHKLNHLHSEICKQLLNSNHIIKTGIISRPVIFRFHRIEMRNTECNEWNDKSLLD